MDRRVKERLVGATILMMLVVLIVPELLSGTETSQRRAAGKPRIAESNRDGRGPHARDHA